LTQDNRPAASEHPAAGDARRNLAASSPEIEMLPVNGDAGGLVTTATVANGIFAFAVTLEQLRSIPAPTQFDDGVSVRAATSGDIVIVTFGEMATDCAAAADISPNVNAKNTAINRIIMISFTFFGRLPMLDPT